MKNNYFIYDSTGFSNQGLKELSTKLEELGFEYHKYSELGGAPGIEQVVVWLTLHRDTIAENFLVIYIVKILDKMYDWYRKNKNKKNIIPLVKIFIHVKNKNIEKFYRIDQKHTQEEIKIVD